LLPALLPKDEPDTGSWEGALAFELHYDVLPESIISRFLVRMHNRIWDRKVWRYGAVLEDRSVFDLREGSPRVNMGNAERIRARVRADTTDAVVEILVERRSSFHRLFLIGIRNELDQIHATLPGLKVQSKLVVEAEGKRVRIDYDDLLAHEKLG